MISSAYIHIPFCEHICHYCDFNKVFLKNQPVEEYLSLLKKEMELTLHQYKTDQLKTIYVGGGTPTALNEEQLEQLCLSINETLPYDRENVEYSFEANPGDLSERKLAILKEYGVNRLSFGVQSFNDELLKKIGRAHRAADVFTTLDKARDAGFENISIDLIYALPGQTLEDFCDTLKTAMSLELPHFSGYSLIIEPKTVFYNLLQKGRLTLPPEESEAAMFEMLMEQMELHGYSQYEISNFAKPGYESRHNLTYWNNENYYGFGAGAHSYLADKRRANHGPLKKYFAPLLEGNLPVIEENTVTVKEQMEEEMFLGLRKTKGVSLSGFQSKFHRPLMEVFGEEIKREIELGRLVLEEGFLKLSKQGKFLGNEVFQAFLK
ncbi:oxygen-independent coproporphyrinogen-3 oxidase [Peribacillus deserti]|uniref:Heme chaperone HemW n=1 Tax=Peribacillus deserti TaxID=673318 RepID=A0ABS2QF95_9BACI|nr:radical SAM family heme chaperone HemW [Peribacillus deserti]MBM7691822.1 oxygen-independent coproporphyrinogen-3 oxidase [Peribacillus deserti]